MSQKKFNQYISTHNKNQKLMSRQLPPRSTRGTKPPQTQQQKQKDNEIYQKLFGNNLDDEQDFVIKKKNQDKRRQCISQNIKKYSYSRAHHYFFDLDTFPRLQNHPSYAIDGQNAFSSHFRQQDRSINGSKIKEIFNRTYFGLPYTFNQIKVDEQAKTKNICHGYLFDYEDNRYGLERLKYFAKIAKKRLGKLVQSNKITQFIGVMKKDSELQILKDKNVSIQYKTDFLNKKIQSYSEKSDNYASNIKPEEISFFNLSINQRLHDEIDRHKQRLSLNKIIQKLAIRQQYFNLARTTEERVTQYIKESLTYFESQCQALRIDQIKALNPYKGLFTKLVDNKPLIKTPYLLLLFSKPYILKIVRLVLITFTMEESKQLLLIMKHAYFKLFGYELNQKEIQQYKFQDNQHTALLLLCKIAQQTKARQGFKIKQQTVNLGEYLNYELLQKKQETQRFSLFKQIGSKSQISGKEAIIMILLIAIYRGVQCLISHMQTTPLQNVLLLFKKRNIKYLHIMLGATTDPYVGTLRFALEYLSLILQRSDPFEGLKIQMDINVKQGVALIGEREDAWQTQSQQEVDQDLDSQESSNSQDQEGNSNGQRQKKLKKEQVKQSNSKQVERQSSEKKEGKGKVEEKQSLEESSSEDDSQNHKAKQTRMMKFIHDVLSRIK